MKRIVLWFNALPEADKALVLFGVSLAVSCVGAALLYLTSCGHCDCDTTPARFIADAITGTGILGLVGGMIWGMASTPLTP